MELEKLRSHVKSNRGKLASQEFALEMMQRKMAEMEDWSWCCNVRVIELPEGIQGSNAIQFLTSSLPKWFPSLSAMDGEIMRAQRVYSDDRKKSNGPRTLIFNTLRFTARQLILRASTKIPAHREWSLGSVFTWLQRLQAFAQAMNTARNK